MLCYKENKEPEIQWRIWGNDIVASQIENHNKLCVERIETKEKTSKVDKKFMEISNRIAAEIATLTKPRVSSAIIHKRNLLTLSGSTKNTLPINSPLITSRALNKLPQIIKAIDEAKQASTPSMPARSKGIELENQDKFQMK